MVAQQGDETMRTTMVLMAMCAGCVTSGERATIQEVTGVTVTVRDAGQLAVSWTADPVAARYLVYQSAGGALPALVATVLDSGGGAPATSWIATGLTSGVEYCYSIRSVFADGGVGAPGGSACGTATGDAVLQAHGAVIVAGADFAVTAGAATLSGSRWTFPTGGASVLVANLRLSAGAVVTGADWALNTGSVGIFTGEFDYSLTRRHFGDGGSPTTVGVGIDSAMSGWLAMPTGGLPLTAMPDTIYTLTIMTSGGFTGAPAFDGVRITMQ